MSKMNLREIKWPAQSDTSGKWQSQDWGLGGLSPISELFELRHTASFAKESWFLRIWQMP